VVGQQAGAPTQQQPGASVGQAGSATGQAPVQPGPPTDPRPAVQVPNVTGPGVVAVPGVAAVPGAPAAPGTAAAPGAAPQVGTPSTGTLAPIAPGATAPGAGLVPKPTPAPCPADTGAGTSAAVMHDWGRPDLVDEFDGTSLDKNWEPYDGPGHNGAGRRSPGAFSLKDGILTVTGTPDGTTGGMALGKGQRYGRWEARVKAPAADPSYHAVMLLWPDAENWPVGGEVDFMEMSDPTRQSTDMFLHYGKDNEQVHGSVDVDATQWHNWAVEWTPDHITAFLDGKQWWTTKDSSILPPGPMHLTIQLDWFPEGGTVQQSEMQVDWVKQYPLSGADKVEGDVAHAGSVVEGVVEGAVDRAVAGAVDAARGSLAGRADAVSDAPRAVADRTTATAEGAADAGSASAGAVAPRGPLTEGAPDALLGRAGVDPGAADGSDGVRGVVPHAVRAG
jgi:beta-glucanase (GH16 family)